MSGGNDAPEWEWLKGVKIGAVGGDALRERCTRVLDAERNRIVLFGGKLHSKGSAIGSRCTPQALCLAYSLEEKSFEPLRTSGALPPCLWGHSACLSSGLMYVFGGRDIKTGELNSTLYALDLESLIWSVPLIAGDSPSARYGHSCTCFEEQLVIHGGMCEDDKFLSDTFILHAASKRWISLPSGPARAFHATAMLGETMLVYGGRDSQGTSRDVFLLDCLEGEWSLQQMFSSKSTAVPDRRESSCLVPFDGKLVIIGGTRSMHDSRGTLIPIMLLSVDDEMLQWNVQKTKGLAPSYGDVSAFVVSDGARFVILCIGDCGISFLATGVPIEVSTSDSDIEDTPVEVEKPAFKSMSAGQLGILGGFGIGRKKKKSDSSSLLKTEVKDAAMKPQTSSPDFDNLSIEELREQADKFIKANEYQFQREKPTKVSGKDLLLLRKLIEKERRVNQEFVGGMEELRGVVDTCYDLSACAERQQRKLSKQGNILEASLEHCRDDLAIFQAMASNFIHDDSQRELANAHLKTVMDELNSCMASVRYLCQTAELPRIGTMPSLFSSPRSPHRTLVGSGGFVAAPASVTASPRSPRSPRSPKGSRLAPSSPTKEEWRRRSRSLLRSAKEVTSVDQAAEEHATPSRRSSDTSASRSSGGEWSPRKSARPTPSLNTRNPSPSGDPNGSKKELIMSLSGIEDHHRRKEADALVRELGSEAPKLVSHTKQVLVLEAYAAAAGDLSMKPSEKKTVPAVPPRAGRRSLQMKQEGYHISGGDTRKLMSRASTKNMIEMCKALEAAEPSEQYNLVVNELVNTERQFVSDMLAVNMMFMKPLSEKLKGIISEEDFRAMFGNSTELLEQSRQFFSQVAIEAAKPPEQQNFAALFTTALDSMFPEFLPYCTNLLLARRTKSRLMRTNPAFLQFLQDVAKDSRCEQQDLKSYLIKPLQRLCKYPLLLSEMQKHCGEHQKQSLEQALAMVKAFVADVNDKLLKDEDMEPLYEIQDAMYPSLSGAVPKVALQGRRLLASYQILHLVTRKGSKKVRARPCVLYLFSDIIILCEEVKGRNMLRVVLPVDGTNAEQVTEEVIPALKGRSVGFVLELSGAQAGSIYIACSDPTELASLRHSLSAAKGQK